MRTRRDDAHHDGYTTLAGVAAIALAVLGLLLHGAPVAGLGL
jgi:hypothetical protein